MQNSEAQDDLSAAQEEIMNLIWDHGELTALQVADLLKSSRSVSKTTVRTLMERMVQKGWLQHRQDGRTYVYRATRPRQKAIGAALLDVMERLCAGNPESLVSALLHEKKLSVSELDRISDLLKEERAKRSRTKRGASE